MKVRAEDILLGEVIVLPDGEYKVTGRRWLDDYGAVRFELEGHKHVYKWDNEKVEVRGEVRV